MSDAIRRFIFAKHYGATAVELRHDKGTNAGELVAQWTRETVDQARAALDKPDPAAIDVVAELLQEGQSYADALATSVLFQIRIMRDGAVKASRPLRLKPTPDEVTGTGDNRFKDLLDAVLKSNTQLREWTEANAKTGAAMLTAVSSVLDAVAKQKVEAASPVTIAPEVLSDEEKEEVLARSAIIRAAAGKTPEAIDLAMAALSKWLKIGEEDAGMLAAAAKLTAGAASMNGTGAVVTATTATEGSA